MDMTIEKANKCAQEFLDWVLDDQGNPKQDLIDYGYEIDFDNSNYWLLLYVNYETEAPPEFENYWKGLCTFVELMYIDSSAGAFSSCYGYALDDIATEIYQVCKEQKGD